MTSLRIQSRLFCIIRRSSCLHSPRLFSSTAPTSARRRTRVAKESEYDVDNLPEFKFDDITTPAHEMMAAQKEVRKYLRKMLFEIPQLTEYATPFVPPQPSQLLCFKSIYYVGEYSPLQEKAVMTVNYRKLARHLNLTDAQLHKLLLLCGPRVNVRTKEIKFSCERFPYLAQNKKYLSDLLNRLIEEAKNPEDTFADIPLDKRHLKPEKRKLKFPKEWLIPEKEEKENQTVGEAVVEATGEADGEATIKATGEAVGEAGGEAVVEEREETSEEAKSLTIRTLIINKLKDN